MVLAAQYGYLDMESLLAGNTGKYMVLLVVALLVVACMVETTQIPVHT